MGRRARLPEVTNARGERDSTGPSRLPRHDALDRLSAVGNQLATKLLRQRPRVEPAGSKAELEAERAANALTGATAERHIRPAGASRRGRTHTSLGGGQPLPARVRERFESRLGQPLDQVRVHQGEAAERSAATLDSRAFTYGNDIIFGRNEYAPSTAAGEKLLAHELSHVVQQQGAPAPSVAKQGPAGSSGAGAGAGSSGGSGLTDPSLIPPFFVPGTGLTLIPGPLASGVLGSPIPLPGSLRLTNALNLGSGPSFVVNLDPRQLVGTFLGDLVLSSSSAEGTPPHLVGTRGAQQRTLLRDVVLRLDTNSGLLRGRGTLVVPTGYPGTFKSPTEIDVEIQSSELGVFSGRLGYGPLHADFSLRLHYDVSRLERAAGPVFAPQGGFTGFWSRLMGILHASAPGLQLQGPIGDQMMTIVRDAMGGRINGELFAEQTLALLVKSIPATADMAALRRALSELASEFTHPGFTLTGGLGLGPIPLSRYSIEAPTTRPLAHPLPGAPTAFPSTVSAYGTVIAPAGNITSVPVPAFGGLYSRFDERSGFSVIGGLLPSLSTTAISAHQPAVDQFPVYAFAEASYVRRASSALDLGVRLTIQTSTADLFGRTAATPTDPVSRYNAMMAAYIDARSNTPTPLVPTAGITVFGRWGGSNLP